MGMQTITLTDEAYERLRANRRERGDSFSRVIMRARWEREEAFCEDFLKFMDEEPAFYTSEELDLMKEVQSAG